METFYIDFAGYCEIEAENVAQAQTEFWRLIQEELPLPKDFYEIQGIQKKELDRKINL